MRTEFDTRDDRTMALGTVHLDEQRVTLMEVPGELQNSLNALRVQKVPKRTKVCTVAEQIVKNCSLHAHAHKPSLRPFDQERQQPSC